MSVRERLALFLAEAPADAPVIEFEGTWTTWGDLRAASGALDASLEQLGVGRGGRVGIVMDNRPELVAAAAAVLATGRCIVTLSGLQPPERRLADIERSDLPVVLVSAHSAARDDRNEHGSAVLELDSGGVPTLVARRTRPDERVTATRPGTAIEMLTSGTTGPPKRVSLTDRQLDRSMVSGGQRPGDPGALSAGTGIVATPMVHIGGLWGALAALYTGRRIALMPKFELEAWVSAVERHRPIAGGLVPAAMRAVLDADVPAERLSSLRVITSGTAHCPVELAEAFTARYGIPVMSVYGATEFAGAVAGWTLPLHREWWDRKKGSAGRAFPGVELRVVAPDGSALLSGASGHLEVRTAQSAAGDTAWVRTADLAHLDDDGFVWIDGRSDDAIQRGGFKISPATVKAALESHPAVREAGVAGRPDPRLGAVPVAAVELLPGAPVPDPAELVAHCRAALAPYEVPVRIIVVDELPRTPSSKVSQVELLELVDAAIAAEAVAS